MTDVSAALAMFRTDIMFSSIAQQVLESGAGSILPQSQNCRTLMSGMLRYLQIWMPNFGLLSYKPFSGGFGTPGMEKNLELNLQLVVLSFQKCVVTL